MYITTNKLHVKAHTSKRFSCSKHSEVVLCRLLFFTLAYMCIYMSTYNSLSQRERGESIWIKMRHKFIKTWQMKTNYKTEGQQGCFLFPHLLLPDLAAFCDLYSPCLFHSPSLPPLSLSFLIPSLSKTHY